MGDVIKNPDYGDTINRLARNGAGDLYSGDLAAEIADDLQKNGAYITADDLREYRTTTYTPSRTGYGRYAVASNAPPGGGPLLQEALNVLDGLDIGEMEHNGVEYIATLASTFQLVNEDRRAFLGDPEVIGDGPGRTLLSKERAAVLRDAVKKGVIGGVLPPYESPDTIHLTVVDGEGNVAAVTHSLGNNSGVVSPGTGFVYNNGMGRFDPRPGRASSFAPRKARLHLTMPSIVFEDDRAAVVLGAPGGNAILPALTQSFTNVVDFGMTATEAVTAPRIHAEGSKIWCEGRTRTDTCDALRERGFTVLQDSASLGKRFAKAQVVVIGPDGELDGGSDPRGSMGVVRARG